jgi:hypothetical protein
MEVVVIGAKGLLEVGGKGSVVCGMVVVVPIIVETVVPVVVCVDVVVLAPPQATADNKIPIRTIETINFDIVSASSAGL